MEILIVVLMEIAFGGAIYGLCHMIFDTKDKKSSIKAVEVENKKKKSEAYAEGYKDMLRGGLSYRTHIEEEAIEDEYSYLYRNTWDSLPDTIIYFDNKRNPFFSDDLMLRMAKEVMEGTRSINIEAGQYDDTYVGGSDEMFAEYYAGGMKFLEDLDAFKQKVLDKKAEEENRKRLIANRRAGLKEINKRVDFKMEALDGMRAEAFAPELTMKEEWNKQWSEQSKN